MVNISKSSVDISRFIKVYSNISLEERKLTIIVIGGDPFTWNLAYNEIKNRTELGIIILNELIKLDII